MPQYVHFDGLIYQVLLKFAQFINPLIEKSEKRVIKAFDDKPYRIDPVFLIGAPRTGSTLIYQGITNSMNVIYIDNLMDILHRNMFYGAKLSNYLFGSKPHNCFKSRFGNTFRYGLHAPSESGRFWYRWIHRGQHFVDKNELEQKSIDAMRSVIEAIEKKYNKTFIFKNLANGLRLRLIHQVFPNAKFIDIKRNPLDTAFSLLNARKQLNIPPDMWWGIIPPNHPELENLEELEKVVKQIYYIERQIKRDKELFPEDNFLTVHYEDFCRNTFVEMQRIKNFVDPHLTIHEALLPDIQSPDKKTKHRDYTIQKKLENIIAELNWESYEL